MAHFTVELWRAIELTDGNIGLDSYPIFDPNYRTSLNEKITDHYHGREIGQETISMFRLAMRRKMNEIMPYYNQLYKTEQMVFDPFSTVDIRVVANGDSGFNTVRKGESNVESDTSSDGTSTATSTNEGNTSGVTDSATTGHTDGESKVSGTEGLVNTGETSTSSDSDSESRAVNSDTPQTMLAGNQDYATAATDARSTSGASTSGIEGSTSDKDSEQTATTEGNETGSAHATSTGTENSTGTTKADESNTGKATSKGDTEDNVTNTANESTDSRTSGYQGNQTEMLMMFRSSLLNIDMLIIEELKELFMLVWDDGNRPDPFDLQLTLY